MNIEVVVGFETSHTAMAGLPINPQIYDERRQKAISIYICVFSHKRVTLHLSKLKKSYFFNLDI